MWLLKYEVFDNHNSKHFHRLIFSYLLSTYISSEGFLGGLSYNLAKCTPSFIYLGIQYYQLTWALVSKILYESEVETGQ